MRFFLFNKKNKLIFLALIAYAAKDRKEDTMHIALSISTCKAKSSFIYINKI